MKHVEVFLAEAQWSDAQVKPLAGDLSRRRYHRIGRNDGSTAILMEDDDATSLKSFIAMTEWLQENHLSAPTILAKNVPLGLLLLEDFGDAKLSHLINESPSDHQALFNATVDVLAYLATLRPPALTEPSATELINATGLLESWYPKVDPPALNELRDTLGAALKLILKAPKTLSLRDFHSDNVIWLPGRTGMQRIGLLDYQDAFLIHPAYDLMSLVMDARINVPKEVQINTIKRWAALMESNVDDVQLAVAVLGLQRNLRILGVFLRAAKRDRKPTYISALPRVRSNIEFCLEHPAFQDVAHLFDKALPPVTKLSA